ncbi:MAG TPA: LysE/ArgO family amino acid transporter [Bacteroidia bacterium]|nr:LysE/ArgO family amino acid transporter [Bacteroidia bacterium]
MSLLKAFIYGAILAFGLIIPLGVQNVFVFNQGATQRRLLHALPSVLAAGLCDTILIILAVLGVSVVVLNIAWLKTLIFIVGFCFLMYMGWVTWWTKPVQLQTENTPLSAKKQIGFAVSVSLLNPHALIDTIGVIGTSSLYFSGMEKWVYTFACILVSFGWFFGLSIAGRSLHKLDKTGFLLTMINKLSALIIWSVGLYIGWQLIAY